MKPKFLGNTGDRDWLGCGGSLVITDKQGYTEAHHIDVWRIDCGDVEDEYSKEMKWDVFSFTIDHLQVKEGKLVNEYGHEEWFSDKLDEISKCIGIEKDELIKTFCDENPVTRTWAYDAVGQYYGFIELDPYPVTLTRGEMHNRFRVAWNKS